MPPAAGGFPQTPRSWMQRNFAASCPAHHFHYSTRYLRAGRPGGPARSKYRVVPRHDGLIVGSKN